MKTLVIVNGKGGVGKSTFSAHVAYRSAEEQRKTLAIDLDPQGNLSQALSSETNNKKHKSVADLVYGNEIIEPIVIHQYLHLIPATSDLSKFEADKDVDTYFKLKEKLTPISKEYDLTIIDTPGNLSSKVVCALVASDACIIPVELQDFCIEAVKDVITLIEKIKSRFNPHLNFLGIIGNKYDSTRKKEQEIKAELIKIFGERVLGTVGNRAAINDALTNHMPVWKYRSHGKADIKACEEITSTIDNILNKLFQFETA